jgi:hypothetical protein
VDPLTVVGNLYPLKDTRLSLVSRPIKFVINMLSFKGFEETLYHRIVPARASTAHALYDASTPKHSFEVRGCILRALVGMKN